MKFRFISLTKTELYQLLAAFLLGLIIGALILNLIIAHQIDDLIYKNKDLNNKIKNQEDELKKLEESLAQRKWKVIQKLEIIIETEENKHIKQQLESKLYELLKSIIGRQMNKVDGSLISNTIDDRIIIVDDANYQIDLIWLLLQEETVIKVKAKNDN
jgi:predicted PurR-regulated permease PerM